jgi:hypothetical protein
MLMAGALAACGREDAPAATAPATKGAASANGTVTAQAFSLANGPEMAQVKIQQMIHPQFALTPPEVDSPVIFAVIRNEQQNLASPVLLKRVGTIWRACEVPTAGANPGQREWVHAAASPARHELFAWLDDASASRAWQLTVWHSTDAGLTWQTLAAVKKPTNAAEFAGFVMAANGAGRLSMHLDDDTDNLGHGYYHYSTADGGKNWTGPTFEADDIVEADPQAEDDAIGDAMKSAEVISAP